ncbi:alpha/beta hydrolase [Corynebacterium crudilactis]|uniref:Surface layer protein n=1 Tax=Corynebacterium crudilactis TaxID=1652495 RepID=A0A172QX34_9CORY|nr:alpha/beta hydrolase family protein [Corynebacterium crudilactis]ANE05273.1 surface layer protein [Corynebacterium crudilactis]
MRKGISSILTVAVACSIGFGTAFTGTSIAVAQDSAYDYGMDPNQRYNPIDDIKDRPEGLSNLPYFGSKLTSWGSSDATASSGIVTSGRPQYTDPRYPNGKDNLPKATIDMNPEVLTRLERFVGVDGDRIRQINAYSPSMERTIPLIWVVPEDNSVPGPTVYALGGGDGGQGGENWVTRTDLDELTSENNINLIMPMLGAYSFYADWAGESEDMGGKQQWETFLMHELPEPLEAAIGADGQRSILGMSMSGGSVLNMASHDPNFYSSVGSFSGCAETNSWMGRRGIAATVFNGNVVPEQIFGDVDSDYSRYNDPLLNAEKLGEQDNLYIFAGSGVFSELDVIGENAPLDEDAFKNRVLVGFEIEAMSNTCTHNLKAATDQKGIDTINYDFRATGTHAWDYWNEALHRFYPLMMQGFGLDGGPIPIYNPNGVSSSESSSELSSDVSLGTVVGSVTGSTGSGSSAVREFIAGSSGSSESAGSFYG